MMSRSISPRPHRTRSKLLAGLAALVISAAASGLAAPAAQATHSCDSAEFSFSANLDPPRLGHLTRGPSKAPQPAYFVNSYDGFFMDNDLVVFSPQGAGCEVAIEALNLPTGVTSQMPSTMTVGTSGVGLLDLALEAASDAALGDATVTLRATLGDQVRTLDLPITVEDQPDLVVPSAILLSESQLSAGVLTNVTTSPAVVSLSSSRPDLVQVPESVTISAGFTNRSFPVDVQRLRGQPVSVEITATLGDASDSVLVTVIRR
jgi:hypothetical protein